MHHAPPAILGGLGTANMSREYDEAAGDELHHAPPATLGALGPANLAGDELRYAPPALVIVPTDE